MTPRSGRESLRRIQDSRGPIPSKKEAEAAIVLANAPAAVREVVVKTSEEKKKTDKAIEKSQTAYEKLVAKTKQAWENYINNLTDADIAKIGTSVLFGCGR